MYVEGQQAVLAAAGWENGDGGGSGKRCVANQAPDARTLTATPTTA